MASVISADESFEQAITIALRGDENTDNGLSSRVNLFVRHRRPRQWCRALKFINCVRFQTAQPDWQTWATTSATPSGPVG
jgi:hypothetical protein